MSGYNPSSSSYWPWRANGSIASLSSPTSSASNPYSLCLRRSSRSHVVACNCEPPPTQPPRAALHHPPTAPVPTRSRLRSVSLAMTTRRLCGLLEQPNAVLVWRQSILSIFHRLRPSSRSTRRWPWRASGWVFDRSRVAAI